MAAPDRRREAGRASGPLRRAVRCAREAPLFTPAVAALAPPAGSHVADDWAAPEPANDALIAPDAIGAHVPLPSQRIGGRSRFRGGPRAGLLVSALAHVSGFALATWLITAAPPAFEAGGEEAIPVEVVVAGSEDSAASKEGARPSEVKVDAPLPPDAPPVEIAVPQVEVPPPPEIEVKVDVAEVTAPPPDAPPPVEVKLPAVEVAPPEVPPPVQLALPRVDVSPPETPAPAHIDLPAVDLPPPSPPSDVEFALPAVNIPAPEIPQPVVIAAAPPPKAEAKPPEEPKQVETAKPAAEPKPVEPRPLAQAKPRVEPPKTVARPLEKPKPQPRAKPPEPRQVAAKPPEKPQRVEAPPKPAQRAAPARGTGSAGDGENDRNRAASTRGGGRPGAGGGAAAIAADYRAQVVARVNRYKVYPEQARDRGITGRVTVSFTLSRDGQVRSISLVGSSGAPVLDSALLATVRRAAPFPEPPPGAPLSFLIAMTYNMQ